MKGHFDRPWCTKAGTVTLPGFLFSTPSGLALTEPLAPGFPRTTLILPVSRNRDWIISSSRVATSVRACLHVSAQATQAYIVACRLPLQILKRICPSQNISMMRSLVFPALLEINFFKKKITEQQRQTPGATRQRNDFRQRSTHKRGVGLLRGLLQRRALEESFLQQSYSS